MHPTPSAFTDLEPLTPSLDGEASVPPVWNDWAVVNAGRVVPAELQSRFDAGFAEIDRAFAGAFRRVG